MAERCSVKTANWLESELDEIFPQDCEIQDFIADLALYVPQGGDYLINEVELVKKCKYIWKYIVNLNIKK